MLCKRQWVPGLRRGVRDESRRVGDGEPNRERDLDGGRRRRRTSSSCEIEGGAIWGRGKETSKRFTLSLQPMAESLSMPSMAMLTL